MNLKFRNIRASEIECRVSTINDKGLSLLLYKDARVDQRILDETVGPMNWQRHHLRDNANCIVSIWDEDKKQWIEKEDTGKESNTEAEKGLASDSFKRACFNWGIGRELYTAPFIWIGADRCNIKAGKNGKPACYDNFYVEQIEIIDGNITWLIVSSKSKGCVFTFGKPSNKADDHTNVEPPTPPQEEAPVMVDDIKVKVIKDKIYKKALNNNSILQYYKVTEFEEMTVLQWKNAMDMLDRYQDKR